MDKDKTLKSTGLMDYAGHPLSLGDKICFLKLGAECHHGTDELLDEGSWTIEFAHGSYLVQRNDKVTHEIRFLHDYIFEERDADDPTGSRLKFSNRIFAIKKEN